jgi:hypothetical protein
MLGLILYLYLVLLTINQLSILTNSSKKYKIKRLK